MCSFFSICWPGLIMFSCDDMYKFTLHDVNLYNTCEESLLIFFHLNYMYIHVHVVYSAGNNY